MEGSEYRMYGSPLISCSSLLSVGDGFPVASSCGLRNPDRMWGLDLHSIVSSFRPCPLTHRVLLDVLVLFVFSASFMLTFVPRSLFVVFLTPQERWCVSASDGRYIRLFILLDRGEVSLARSI